MAITLTGIARPNQERICQTQKKPLREQMTEAMKKIRQQVEILRDGPTMGEPSDDRSLVAELEAEFEAIKQARAKLSSEEH